MFYYYQYDYSCKKLKAVFRKTTSLDEEKKWHEIRNMEEQNANKRHKLYVNFINMFYVFKQRVLC